MRFLSTDPGAVWPDPSSSFRTFSFSVEALFAHAGLAAGILDARDLLFGATEDADFLFGAAPFYFFALLYYGS